jgi:hypothetical protein
MHIHKKSNPTQQFSQQPLPDQKPPIPHSVVQQPRQSLGLRQQSKKGYFNYTK